MDLNQWEQSLLQREIALKKAEKKLDDHAGKILAMEKALAAREGEVEQLSRKMETSFQDLKRGLDRRRSELEKREKAVEKSLRLPWK